MTSRRPEDHGRATARALQKAALQTAHSHRQTGDVPPIGQPDPKSKTSDPSAVSENFRFVPELALTAGSEREWAILDSNQ